LAEIEAVSVRVESGIHKQSGKGVVFLVIGSTVIPMQPEQARVLGEGLVSAALEVALSQKPEGQVS